MSAGTENPNSGDRFILTDNAEAQKIWYSEQVTSLVRTLGLSAFASAWLFAGALGKNADNARETLNLLHHDCDLAVVAIFALLALTFDFMQMLTGTATWAIWGWCSRIITDEESDDAEWLVRFAYWIARCLGLARYLAEGDRADDLSTFRRRLHARESNLIQQLAQPVSSGLVTVVPFVFFVAKCLALVTSYVALLIFVI